MRLPLLSLCLAAASAAQPPPAGPGAAQPSRLELRVEELLKQHPAVAQGAWGALAIDLATGQVLFQHNSTHTFVPASNNKLYSTALALNRLGPEYRFTTRLLAAAPPGADGTLPGGLILEGSGDPSLSGRAWPYRRNAPVGPPLSALDELAAQIQARGIRRIRGPITGDDRAYLYEPFPPGWAADDTLYDYGAPVSALVLHDNYLTVRLDPARPGELAHLSVTPETGYVQFTNRVLTTASGPSRISELRSSDGRSLELTGTVALNSPVSLDLAIADPARYAAHALRDLLLRRGIAVEGGIEVRHRYSATGAPAAPAAVELARRDSPPLSQLIQATNKLSQNLYAELLLRETARAAGGYGARRAALGQLSAWLRSLGAPAAGFSFSDGSGLSRLALVSPETTMRVLRALYEGPHREVWLDSLPIGGEDGTLASRFKSWTGGRVRAKTGTLTHVTALSGYVDFPNGPNPGAAPIAFSIMVNNANSSAAGSRAFIDGLIQALAGLPQPAPASPPSP